MPNVITNVPAIAARSKIIFPTVPPVPPTLTMVADPPGTDTVYDYGVATWVLQAPDGTQYESLPSAVAGPVGRPGTSKLSVTAPVTPSPTTALGLIGWNLYVGENSTGTGPTPTLYFQSQIAIGTGFDAIPTLSGVQPPTSWGNELIFTYPGRQFPYFNPVWKGHDDFSTAGWQQSITWYIDSLTDFEVPYIQAGTDAWAWKQFLIAALKRVPFDFYPDSTLGTFSTLINIDTNPKMAYKYPGLYSLKLKCREIILTQ